MTIIIRYLQIIVRNCLMNCEFKFFIREINYINNKKILLFIGQICFYVVFRTVKSTKNFITDHDTKFIHDIYVSHLRCVHSIPCRIFEGKFLNKYIIILLQITKNCCISDVKYVVFIFYFDIFNAIESIISCQTCQHRNKQLLYISF